MIECPLSSKKSNLRLRMDTFYRGPWLVSSDSRNPFWMLSRVRAPLMVAVEIIRFGWRPSQSRSLQQQKKCLDNHVTSSIDLLDDADREMHDGRAPSAARRRSVAEGNDVRQRAQHPRHHGALRAAAAAVHQAHVLMPRAAQAATYSSTTEGMSRGANACRSSSPVSGIATGGSSPLTAARVRSALRRRRAQRAVGRSRDWARASAPRCAGPCPCGAGSRAPGRGRCRSTAK